MLANNSIPHKIRLFFIDLEIQRLKCFGYYSRDIAQELSHYVSIFYSFLTRSVLQFPKIVNRTLIASIYFHLCSKDSTCYFKSCLFQTLDKILINLLRKGKRSTLRKIYFGSIFIFPKNGKIGDYHDLITKLREGSLDFPFRTGQKFERCELMSKFINRNLPVFTAFICFTDSKIDQDSSSNVC